MNKFGLIVEREFSTRVKKKSFIILTILMPFIFAALIFVPIWLSSIKDDNQKMVGVCDKTQKYLPLLKTDATYRFVPVANADDLSLYADTTEYEAVISIQADLATHPKAVAIYSRKEVPAGLLSYVSNVINEKIRHDKLAAPGIARLDKIIDEVQ